MAELDGIVEIVRTAFAVHLRNEAVEHADVATVAEQLVCQMRADEARATSDEHVARHAAAPVRADAPMPVMRVPRRSTMPNWNMAWRDRIR